MSWLPDVFLGVVHRRIGSHGSASWDFVSAVRHGADVVLGGAGERTARITAHDVNNILGEKADSTEAVENVYNINSEVFTELLQMMPGGAFEVVMRMRTEAHVFEWQDDTAPARAADSSQYSSSCA